MSENLTRFPLSFLNFGSEMHRQIVDISMGTNCAPLVASLLTLFLFCYERDFMLSSDIHQADVVEVFKYASRYLDDLINNDNPYFEQVVSQIIRQNQFNKAKYFDTEAPCFGFEVVHNKWHIYDKWDDLLIKTIEDY